MRLPRAGRVRKLGRIRLHRYIFGQLFLAASMAIALFVFVLVTGNVLKEVAGPLAAGQITPTMFAYLVAIAVPGVLPYALPLGLLTAVLLVLGRLSAQNELTAMKSAGLSLSRITAPVFALGLLGTGISALINIYYAPVADTAFRETLRSAAREDPLRFFTPRAFIKDFPGYVIFAEARRRNELRDIMVWELDEQQRATRVLQGQRAFLAYDEADAAIVLTVFEATGQLIDPELPPSQARPGNTLMFERSEFRLPLDALLGARPEGQKLAFLTLDELLRRRELAREIGGADGFAARISVQSAIQKKFALSFAVLSLCWVAIPLGIKASRTETHANFALALALALTYFLLFVLCSWTGQHPRWRPDLLIWLPNLLFQALGATLYWRACQR